MKKQSKGKRKHIRKLKARRRKVLEKLSVIEQAVIEFIIKHIKGKHRPPTLREIAREMVWHHTRAAQIVNSLAAKGYIIKDADASRGIRLNTSIYEVIVIEK